MNKDYLKTQAGNREKKARQRETIREWILAQKIDNGRGGYISTAEAYVMHQMKHPGASR